MSSGFVHLEADWGSAIWFFSTNAAKPAVTTIRLTGAGTESPDYCTPWKEVQKLGHLGSAPAAGYCVPQLAGSNFQTSNERAVTWSTGFSIPTLGFNGQAQTGYDTSAQLPARTLLVIAERLQLQLR